VKITLGLLITSTSTNPLSSEFAKSISHFGLLISLCKTRDKPERIRDAPSSATRALLRCGRNVAIEKSKAPSRIGIQTGSPNPEHTKDKTPHSTKAETLRVTK
jgi:hypothetical protein